MQMHLGIIVVHGGLDTVAALLTHFPHFALMLRVKDPMRIPGTPLASRADTRHSTSIGHIVFRRLPSGSLLLEVCLTPHIICGILTSCPCRTNPPRCPPSSRTTVSSTPSVFYSAKLMWACQGQLLARLSSHYHPVRLLGLLMSGRILTLIPRSAIRFSMIPVPEADSHIQRPH